MDMHILTQIHKNIRTFGLDFTITGSLGMEKENRKKSYRFL